MSASTSFRLSKSVEAQHKEAQKILERYPDRVPIIVEKSAHCNKSIPNLKKIKYLAPRDITMGQFAYVIRKRLKLPEEKALFLSFSDHSMTHTASLVSQAYEQHKDDATGFLFVEYTGENTFGQ
ncbi:MAG: hypothetical protein K0U52_07175 [Gammaproteobacteria bacterium]|nr:hypothetical protein [Gammaproteobacteria bacterium]